MRGEDTSSRTSPARQRSPTRAPLTSTPRTVRFSPNVPGPSSRPSWAAPPLVVLGGIGVQRLVVPRRATSGLPCSSPSTLVPRTPTRPGTGSFQIAVRTVCPRQLISLGSRRSPTRSRPPRQPPPPPARLRDPRHWNRGPPEAYRPQEDPMGLAPRRHRAAAARGRGAVDRRADRPSGGVRHGDHDHGVGGGARTAGAGAALLAGHHPPRRPGPRGPGRRHVAGRRLVVRRQPGHAAPAQPGARPAGRGPPRGHHGRGHPGGVDGAGGPAGRAGRAA